MHPFIQTQLDNQERDLDFWKEIIKKAVNAKVKASLQLFSGTKEIDTMCQKGYKPSTKKDKNEANQKH